ncbi:MAG: MTH1187 family thiamine-binding protein [Candidatus Hydrothermales bacterium]
MKKVIAAISITPIGTGSTSLSEFVAQALKVLEKYKDIEHDTDPMFTILYGDKQKIFEAIIEMQEEMFKMGAKRVSTIIKIDERRDKDVKPTDKIESLKKHLKSL